VNANVPVAFFVNLAMPVDESVCAQELVVRRHRDVDERGVGVDDGRAQAEARAGVGEGRDPDAPVKAVRIRVSWMI
jgi:hypothetical protein